MMMEFNLAQLELLVKAGLDVLVIEDDPNTAALVALYLERESFRVLTAGDGKTLVQALREHRQATLPAGADHPHPHPGAGDCRSETR